MLQVCFGNLVKAIFYGRCCPRTCTVSGPTSWCFNHPFEDDTPSIRADIIRDKQNCLHNNSIATSSMASTVAGLLGQSRSPRSEVSGKPLEQAVQELRSQSYLNPPVYPGSLHRHRGTRVSLGQFRSMLDIEDPPSISPFAIAKDSMEDWVSGKLSQTSQKHYTAGSDWADILCFYTATNGAAPAAPTRAPAPIPSGGSSPLEIPQSVSSTDPKIAAQQASDMRNIVRRKLTGYVGFANLPNQWHRKSVRKGFNFNVMVVGKLGACCFTCT